MGSGDDGSEDRAAEAEHPALVRAALDVGDLGVALGPRLTGELGASGLDLLGRHLVFLSVGAAGAGEPEVTPAPSRLGVCSRAGSSGRSHTFAVGAGDGYRVGAAGATYRATGPGEADRDTDQCRAATTVGNHLRLGTWQRIRLGDNLGRHFYSSLRLGTCDGFLAMCGSCACAIQIVRERIRHSGSVQVAGERCG